MTDIVAELRKGAYTDALDDILMKQAADEIERLRIALGGAIDYTSAIGRTYPDLVLSVHGMSPIQEVTDRWRSCLDQQERKVP